MTEQELEDEVYRWLFSYTMGVIKTATGQTPVLDPPDQVKEHLRIASRDLLKITQSKRGIKL